MRSWSSCAGWVAAGLSAGAIFYGCGQQSFGSCADNATCAGDGGDDANVEASSSGGGGGEGGGGETGSPGHDAASSADAAEASPPDALADTWDGYDGFTCDVTKGPRDESCVISDSLGVFVAPAAYGGNNSGNGTMEHPYETITYALGHLNGSARVYVCDAQYAESVSISSVVSLYGGLACPGGDAGSEWSYVGGRASVTAPAGSYALHVTGVTTAIEVQDMGFTVPDATGVDSNGNGSSSIAALVSGSTVNFARVVLTAGSGAQGDPGADGVSAPNYTGATASSGNAGYSPADGGNGSGAGGTVMCSVYGSSAGGAGGLAGTDVIPGSDGGPGISSPMATTSGVRDGAAGTGAQGTCTNGHSGADGAAGSAGVTATALGVLSTTGWAPSAGGVGQPGAPGQGGGGGGGQGTPSVGGDGGGAGGCGGAGGAGGKGGGASVALASVSSTIKLTACLLTTATGGNGGTGGAGQDGQAGGARGLGGSCAGGYGGNGAGGSGGAGGTAGISVGILYRAADTAPIPDGTTSFNIGSAGQPGMAGAPGHHGSGALTTGNDGNSGAGGFADASASGTALGI